MPETLRIAVYHQPSLDALVAVWMARRFLNAGQTLEVVFFPKGHPVLKEQKIAWCAEPDSVPSALEFGWGVRQRSFPERYAASATGHLWVYLLSVGKPVNHLIDLVDAVHATVTGKIGAGKPWCSLASRLGSLWSRVVQTTTSDLARADAVGLWLDKYERDLRRCSTTPTDWEEIAERLPKALGTYALVLSSRAPRSLLVGRTGYLGRMLTKLGYYVYLGSALSGVRGRDKHHLAPADQLKAKWQVDSLRLVCSLEEIWYTESPYPWECSWARCMMSMPDAVIPTPKGFGTTGCEGKCKTHLLFFRQKPCLETFQEKVKELRPGRCRVERLVVHQGA